MCHALWIILLAIVYIIFWLTIFGLTTKPRIYLIFIVYRVRFFVAILSIVV